MQIEPLPSDVRAYLRSGVAITSVSQCVEELVLNALDAGATCVAVRVDLSCFKVQVVDNGFGVPKDQLEHIGNRFCTSKCHGLTDLNNLCHFGYRGEALASIRESSRILEITSRCRLTDKTYCKIFQNGKSMKVTESVIVRPSAGTTVTVHELFVNFPVRQKSINRNFEIERIREMLEGIALIRTSVSFSLRNDPSGQVILSTKKTGNISRTFSHMYGDTKGDMLVEIKGSKDNFVVSGYFGREGHPRKNLQFVYVNGRLVKKSKIHKLLNKLLLNLPSLKQKSRQYSDSPTMTTSKPNPFLSPPKFSEAYPVYILEVKCPLKEYDITFEPAKTMVEFKDWDTLLSCVEEVTKAFLEKESIIVKEDKEEKAESSVTEQVAAVISADNMKDVLFSKTAKRPANHDVQSTHTAKKNKMLESEEVKERHTENTDLNISGSEKQVTNTMSDLFKTPVNSKLLVSKAAVGLGKRKIMTDTGVDIYESSEPESSSSSDLSSSSDMVENHDSSSEKKHLKLQETKEESGKHVKVVSEKNPDTNTDNSLIFSGNSSLSRYRQSIGKSVLKQPEDVSIDQSLKFLPSAHKSYRHTLYSSLQKFRRNCTSRVLGAETGGVNDDENRHQERDTDVDLGADRYSPFSDKQRLGKTIQSECDLCNENTNVNRVSKKLCEKVDQVETDQNQRKVEFGEELRVTDNFETITTKVAASHVRVTSLNLGKKPTWQDGLCSNSETEVNKNQTLSSNSQIMLERSEVSHNRCSAIIEVKYPSEKVNDYGMDQKCYQFDGKISAFNEQSERHSDTDNQQNICEPLIKTVHCPEVGLTTFLKDNNQTNNESENQTRDSLNAQQGCLDIEYVAIPLRTTQSNIDHAEIKYNDKNECNMNDCDKFSIVYETSYASGTQCDTDICDSYRTHFPVEKGMELVPADMASSDNVVCNGMDKEIYPYGTQAFTPQLKEEVSPVLKDKTETPESMGFTPKLEIEDNLDASSSSPLEDWPVNGDNKNTCTSVNTVKTHSGRVQIELGQIAVQSLDDTLNGDIIDNTHTGREQIESDHIEVQSLDDTLNVDLSDNSHSGREQVASDQIQVQPLNYTLNVDITDRDEEMIRSSFKTPNAPKEDNELSVEHANQSFDLSQLLNISAPEVQNSGISTGTEDDDQIFKPPKFSFGDIFSPTQSANSVDSFNIKRNKIALPLMTKEKNRLASMCYECSNSMNSQNEIDVDLTSDNVAGMDPNKVGMTLDNAACIGANKETAKGLIGTESWTDSPWELSDSAIAEADSLVEKYGDNITSAEEKAYYDCSEEVGASGDKIRESVNTDISRADTGNAEAYNTEKIVGNSTTESDSLDAWYNNLDDGVTIPAEVLKSMKPSDVAKQFHTCRFSKESLKSLKVLGQVDKKFIACLMQTEDHKPGVDQDGQVIVLIDQHAAHERIRLEILTEDVFQHRQTGVLAPFIVDPPQCVQFSEQEVRTILTFQDGYSKLGISLKKDTACSLLISSVPACMVDQEKNNKIYWSTVQVLIREHIAVFMSTQVSYGVLPQTIHKVLCSQACHGAIKFGDPLSGEDCEQLLKDLSLCDLPFQCAHGRPSIMPLFNTKGLREMSVNQRKVKPNIWKLTQGVKMKKMSDQSHQKT